MFESGEYLGAKSFPPPFLAPSTKADTIYKGINYASGASGILDETGFLFVSSELNSIQDYFFYTYSSKKLRI